MKYALAFLLMLGVPALADDASQPKNTEAWGSPCDYPAAAVAAHAEGMTRLTYWGRANGTADNVTVIGTSGHADLDQAAVACVSRWYFDPSGPRGETLRGQKDVSINWMLPTDGSKPQGHWAGRPHVCMTYYPPAAVAAHETGTVRLGFIITAQGGVRDVAVVTSSGFADLDEAALACVRTWRYLPAVKDHKPIDVPWLADVKWDLKEPPPPVPAAAPPVTPPKP